VDERGHTRRDILKAAGFAAGAALAMPVERLAAAVAPATSRSPDIGQLADDLFVIRVPGEANVVAQTTAGGVLLVDGASAAGSGALMQAVAALPGGGPVHALASGADRIERVARSVGQDDPRAGEHAAVADD